MSANLSKSRRRTLVNVTQKNKLSGRGSNKDLLALCVHDQSVISICVACYLAHQILPQSDSPCQILEQVHLEGPMVAAVAVVVAVAVAAAAAAAAALGTQLLVAPPLIHLAGIDHFAVILWGRHCKKDQNVARS